MIPKITGLDYLKMSKHDVYEEYCKVYEEYEKNIRKEMERLKQELNNARIEAMIACLNQPIDPKEMTRLIDATIDEALKLAESEGVNADKTNI